MEDGTLKFADYGISIMYQKEFLPTHDGTFDYMAPELHKDFAH